MYKRELLSVIGQHACGMVRPRRTLLKQKIILIPKELHHGIQLNDDFKPNLKWRATLLPIGMEWA